VTVAFLVSQARNAFCAVRPPGHHAGPVGVVTSKRDPHGSHGFCLLNNIAIAGAYAVNRYRHEGVRLVSKECTDCQCTGARSGSQSRQVTATARCSRAADSANATL